MLCDFGLVDNIVNQIADIARSAMEARNFFLAWARPPDDVPSQPSKISASSRESHSNLRNHKKYPVRSESDWVLIYSTMIISASVAATL